MITSVLLEFWIPHPTLFGFVIYTHCFMFPTIPILRFKYNIVVEKCACTSLLDCVWMLNNGILNMIGVIEPWGVLVRGSWIYFSMVICSSLLRLCKIYSTFDWTSDPIHQCGTNGSNGRLIQNLKPLARTL